MGLREELRKKVPEHLKKGPEFKALLEQIKAQDIKGKEELLDFLKKEKVIVERWIAENKKRGGTMVKMVRDKAVKLEMLKRCEELVIGELFV